MSSKNGVAFAGPWDDTALTAAKSRLSSARTTHATKDSVHLHPCSFHDMNSVAVSASGKSAVNSLTFAQSSRVAASFLSHSMRKWPVSSSGPPQKTQGYRGITVRVIFCRHRHMTCVVGRRPSLARSGSRCVRP